MDAGLERITSFEGYQSVGTIPHLFWLARKPERTAWNQAGNSDVFSPPGLLTARLLSAKMASSLVRQSNPT